MCDPITIGLMVAGSLASVAGTGMQQAEAMKSADRVAEARNRTLKETLARNQIKADANRAAVNQRITDSEKGPADKQLTDTQTEQVRSVQANVGPTGVETPIAGEAPSVVKSAFAKSFADAAAKSMARGDMTGKLGAYGAVQRDNAIGDGSLRDNINVNNDAVRGNMVMLPYLQDMAEVRATKPSSGFGQIISALGQAASMYGGSRGKPMFR